ncbi:Multidrug export protein mepA [Serratia plymuthica]|uniref:Multidrug export protein mepA n=1 Tax=Serratia plymuthica TaxID=82996 RepID=A0A2X4V1I0_SERPL|nr:Multidrug export protein mepA [Serratia plymuthica]
MRLLSAFTSDTDKALWRLALPMIFSNITVPLLGLVDTAVIGHLDSPAYLGGVAIGAMATSFLFMLLLFLRMSTTGLAAQALGAQDPQGLARAFMQPLWLAVLAGVAIVLLRHPLIDMALQIVGGDGAVLEQARLFLEIRWLSAPAALANMVILGWLLGVQYVRAPVILLIIGNLLNIVLDIWLVMGLGWNVQGAATATVISEYATLLLGLWLAWRVMRIRGISAPMLRQAWRGNLRRLLALNRDIMLRSLLLQACFASLTIFGARLGGDVVAVNAVLMNLLTFTAYALDGFAYAVEAHSGHAYGARDDSQLRKVWRAACRQACLVALAFWGGVCRCRAANHLGINLFTRVAYAGEPLSAVAGGAAVGRCVVLSAGRHVYWCDPRCRNAQQHGGGGRRLRPDVVYRTCIRQPRIMAGAGGVSVAEGHCAGLVLAPSPAARYLV